MQLEYRVLAVIKLSEAQRERQYEQYAKECLKTNPYLCMHALTHCVQDRNKHVFSRYFYRDQQDDIMKREKHQHFETVVNSVLIVSLID